MKQRSIHSVLAEKEYSFWVEATCPVCEEVVAAYNYTVKEMPSELISALSEHEAWCKSVPELLTDGSER